MKKIVKRLIRMNQLKNKIYEEVEELIDYEDGNLAEIKEEYYEGEPLEKAIFDQFMTVEKEKNLLIKSSSLDKLPGIVVVRQYLEIKAFNRLKKLQKKILGE